MKQIFMLALVMLLALAAVAGCGSSPAAVAPAADTALPNEVSIQQATKLRDAGAFILDVREPSEWNEFHIPNATLIPLGQLEARVAEVPKDKPIVVVCRSGNRSATGRNILKDMGFTNVTSMKGGMTDWRSDGLPTVSGQ